MIISDNKIRHWMNFAKSVEDAENPCYSRKIGVVIIDPITNDLVSIGHNGPPKGCPANDDHNYLKNVVWLKLTVEENALALQDEVFLTEERL